MQSAETMDARHAGAHPGRGSTYWLNLAAAGLVVFYVIYIAWQLLSHMMCSQIGVDFCEYLSAGRVANSHGYAAVYDLSLLQQAQQAIIPPAPGSAPIAVLPFLYLPVFVLPFQLLVLLSPIAGFWIWAILNAALLVFYARWFLRRMALPPASARLMLLIFLSLPVFMNLFLGQLNLLLMVCVGESMVASSQRRFFRAGLCLGGLVLKPQLLILVGLVLLIQRAWRVLAGAVVTCAALGLVSTALVGISGLSSMLAGWLGTAGGQANVWVQGMMNWRMVGTDLARWIGSWAGWTVAGAGMLATLAIMLLAWRRRLEPNGPVFPAAMAGILAACTTLAWHSHIHIAVVLVPPLLVLCQARLLPARVMNYWVFTPALIFVTMVFVPETLIALHLVSTGIEPLIYFILGASELSASLYLFAWAVRFTQTQGLPAHG